MILFLFKRCFLQTRGAGPRDRWSREKDKSLSGINVCGAAAIHPSSAAASLAICLALFHLCDTRSLFIPPSIPHRVTSASHFSGPRPEPPPSSHSLSQMMLSEWITCSITGGYAIKTPPPQRLPRDSINQPASVDRPPNSSVYWELIWACNLIIECG